MMDFSIEDEQKDYSINDGRVIKIKEVESLLRLKLLFMYFCFLF